MIFTRRFWRHSSVLATRSFGQGVVVALGGDVVGAWQELDAKSVLFAGLGMAGASVAMSLGRATVAPRKDTPPELKAINDMVDAHFADAYANAILSPTGKRHRDPVDNDAGQSSYEVPQQASYSFGQTPNFGEKDYHQDFNPLRGGW